ncbi:hypothetical protein Godav_000644 [Gossypium davidsonii]|uniref:Uncharacterized protein n=1 Tax=Gossypium davidsonii TaxID=34287 RepID=A0A7J8T150_GOSDV|nr:hypothetical protein [Gossypium davidsonii]
MKKIQHNHVQAKGLKLHVTQIGTRAIDSHSIHQNQRRQPLTTLLMMSLPFSTLGLLKPSTSCCQGFRGLRSSYVNE